jgi:hypothetical protein
MQTSQNAQGLPKAAVVVTHEVEDFETWKRAFDAHAPARRDAGILAAHVNRDSELPNRLMVYLASDDATKLSAFLSSAGTMSVMRDAGVKGPPHLALITPDEDRTVKDRPLAGVIVRHEVADYAAWKNVFDADSDRRRSAGIVGHAVNRSAQNPNLVVVYLQAESLATLKAFASAPELKDVMKSAGVKGGPELAFVQGAAWSN